MLSALSQLTTKAVFPTRCARCQNPSESRLCSDCEPYFAPYDQNRCERCGMFLFSAQSSASGCLACKHQRRFTVQSSLLYGGAVREAIFHWKYGQATYWTPLFVSWLLRDYGDYIASHDIIIPVPLHPQRLRTRGFNQAQLLAEAIGSQTGVTVDSKDLTRIKKTTFQARSQSRSENLENAFLAKKSSFSGQNVLLIDDIITSGQTLRSCAQALPDAKRVNGLTLARTVH